VATQAPLPKHLPDLARDVREDLFANDMFVVVRPPKKWIEMSNDILCGSLLVFVQPQSNFCEERKDLLLLWLNEALSSISPN
jgi:hypothetical protein